MKLGIITGSYVNEVHSRKYEPIRPDGGAVIKATPLRLTSLLLFFDTQIQLTVNSSSKVKSAIMVFCHFKFFEKHIFVI